MTSTIVGLTVESFHRLSNDAAAFRLLLIICRAIMSSGYDERFAIGTNRDGDLMYWWRASEETPLVSWTPPQDKELNEVEKQLIGSGYAAMVIFPALLATLDSQPEAITFLSEKHIHFTGPAIGIVEIER